MKNILTTILVLFAFGLNAQDVKTEYIVKLDSFEIHAYKAFEGTNFETWEFRATNYGFTWLDTFEYNVAKIVNAVGASQMDNNIIWIYWNKSLPPQPDIILVASKILLFKLKEVTLMANSK